VDPRHTNQNVTAALVAETDTSQTEHSNQLEQHLTGLGNLGKPVNKGQVAVTPHPHGLTRCALTYTNSGYRDLEKEQWLIIAQLPSCSNCTVLYYPDSGEPAAFKLIEP
jgi:hypothetical protein